MNTLETPAAKVLLADRDITAAIERLFARRRGVSADGIDVTTTEGIVMLRGVTDNLLAVDRAEELAKAVRGVRAVINELEVRTPDVADDQLQHDIAAALTTNPATEHIHLACLVHDGEVTMHGPVPNWAERQLVRRVVRGIRGVRRLTDQLSYDMSRHSRTDEDIASALRELLRWSVRVHAGLVKVQVEKGKATLSGAVGSAAERDDVTALAWSVGASQVDDQALRVEPWVPTEELRQDKYTIRSDADLSRAVHDAFVYDPRVFSAEPTVTVQGGVVTLSGSVSNLAAKRAAEQDALGVVGTAWVHNLLKVRPAKPQDDGTVQLRVQQALQRDAYVSRYVIAVEVHNGVAGLTGLVPTHFEAAHVGQVAAGIGGVVHVDNQLQVAPAPLAWFGLGHDTVPSPAVRSDQAVAEAIRQELYWNAFLHEHSLQVRVKNGQATLRGTVDNWHQAQIAIYCALAGGASSVNNKLGSRSEMPA